MEKAVICCACSQQCGVVVRLEDGRIARISGYKNHPISRGFICTKGASAAELHYDRNRVHWPLKRVGKKGGGLWQQVGWEEALDDIALLANATSLGSAGKPALEDSLDRLPKGALVRRFINSATYELKQRSAADPAS